MDNLSDFIYKNKFIIIFIADYWDVASNRPYR